MSILAFFRRKSRPNAMQAEMTRMASTLYPGGHDEIKSAGLAISAMLGNRISTDEAAKLFASTQFLAETAKDQGKPRIVGYIVRKGVGQITSEEASNIYDRFIDPSRQSDSAQPVDGENADTIFVDARLIDRKYHLQNGTRTTSIDAPTFTALLLGVRSNGWDGAAILFDQNGTTMKSLSGSYTISERDAHELAKRLRQLIESQGLSNDKDTIGLIGPLIDISSEGAFTLRT